MAKYKVGDKAVVVREVQGHDIPIGSVVTISEVDEEDDGLTYRSHEFLDNECPWFNDAEIEPYVETVPTHITINGKTYRLVEVD